MSAAEAQTRAETTRGPVRSLKGSSAIDQRITCDDVRATAFLVIFLRQTFYFFCDSVIVRTTHDDAAIAKAAVRNVAVP